MALVNELQFVLDFFPIKIHIQPQNSSPHLSITCSGETVPPTFLLQASHAQGLCVANLFFLSEVREMGRKAELYGLWPSCQYLHVWWEASEIRETNSYSICIWGRGTLSELPSFWVFLHLFLLCLHSVPLLTSQFTFLSCPLAADGPAQGLACILCPSLWGDGF